MDLFLAGVAIVGGCFLLFAIFSAVSSLWSILGEIKGIGYGVGGHLQAIADELREVRKELRSVRHRWEELDDEDEEDDDE